MKLRYVWIASTGVLIGCLCVSFVLISKYQIRAKESESVPPKVSTTPASFKSSLGLPMQFIPGGSFILGMTKEEFEALWPERINLEYFMTKVSSPHKVTLSDYFINATEITQYHYFKVMGINPSYFKGDDLPVERVTWFDAVEFCNKLSILEGLTPFYIIVDRQPAQGYPIMQSEVTRDPNANGFRLPTEAQWEYAAREGRWKIDKTVAYAGSPTIDTVGWHKGNSNYSTHPVGSKLPNSYGLYDMVGNVWEYCQDWYGLYTSIDVSDPQGPDTGTEHVDRGGSWNYPAISHRSATRGSKMPNVTRNVLGFRVVLPVSAFEQLHTQNISIP